jgi:hypothetical protein
MLNLAAKIKFHLQKQTQFLINNVFAKDWSPTVYLRLMSYDDTVTLSGTDGMNSRDNVTKFIQDHGQVSFDF